MNPFKPVGKALSITAARLRDHGPYITLLWVIGRGWPKLTGVPMLRFSEVTPQIYVGAQYTARGKARLEKRGIHYSVNMREEFDDATHGVALRHYCYLPTVDDTMPSPEALDRGVAFIREAVTAGARVYIHCAGGIGRAPTMAAAYFIAEGMSTDDALAHIAKARPFIKPVPEQIAGLRAYEAAQRAL